MSESREERIEDRGEMRVAGGGEAARGGRGERGSKGCVCVGRGEGGGGAYLPLSAHVVLIKNSSSSSVIISPDAISVGHQINEM